MTLHDISPKENLHRILARLPGMPATSGRPALPGLLGTAGLPALSATLAMVRQPALPVMLATIWLEIMMALSALAMLLAPACLPDLSNIPP